MTKDGATIKAAIIKEATTKEVTTNPPMEASTKGVTGAITHHQDTTITHNREETTNTNKNSRDQTAKSVWHVWEPLRAVVVCVTAFSDQIQHGSWMEDKQNSAHTYFITSILIFLLVNSFNFWCFDR